MDRIVRGVHEFQSQDYPPQESFFKRLASKQQRPRALFITCSDSRVHPNLITHTDPGDLFLIRNAGNIVPPYGAANGGEGATIEYSIAVLGIRSIIICGHSQCGAMQALLDQDSIRELPAVAAWFSHAETTRRIAEDQFAHLSSDDRLRAATEENVLVQLNHLSTHPYVASRLARGTLHLYGWYYDIGSGRVLEYQPDRRRFVDLGDAPHPAETIVTRTGIAEEFEPGQGAS